MGLVGITNPFALFLIKDNYNVALAAQPIHRVVERQTEFLSQVFRPLIAPRQVAADNINAWATACIADKESRHSSSRCDSFRRLRHCCSPLFGQPDYYRVPSSSLQSHSPRLL